VPPLAPALGAGAAERDGERRMSQAANLWLYFAVVFGIIILPGLDMAFVMASSMLGGRRSGLAAVAGIMAGGLCHLVMGALGAAALLLLWRALFQAMLAFGAAYLAWIGLSFLRSSSSVFVPGQATPVLAPATAFRRAMLTSLINPKAYLFMLAVFPQFLKPALGPIWIQAGLLGMITLLTQLAVYGALALVSSRAAGWFGRNPAGATIAARAIGVLLIAVAVLTAAQLFGAVAPGAAPGTAHDTASHCNQECNRISFSNVAGNGTTLSWRRQESPKTYAVSS